MPIRQLPAFSLWTIICRYNASRTAPFDREGEASMSTEHHTATVQRLYHDVWNMGNLPVIDELFVSDATLDFLPPGLLAGTAGLKQFITMYRTTFPDIHFTIEDMIADGEKVVTRWTATGTHSGPLMNIPPTGKPVSVHGISITHHAMSGKVVQSWSTFDQLGLLQQLGVIPTLG
jgi:steroid delta-isomerase-like uncharacterized protein